jgi:hypothetical protein
MAGQYRTSTDLVTEALANLGVLSAGQPTDPEDFNYVNEKLDAVLRELAGLEIVFIADSNNIPGVFFSALADIVAGECAQKFGLSTEDQMNLKLLGLGAAPPAGQGPGSGAAAMKIKLMTRLKPTYEVVQTEFM